MDLKDFKNVEHDDVKKVKIKAPLVDAAFHDESDQIIKDLEARIASLNNEDKKVENHIETDEGHRADVVLENLDSIQNDQNI